jgi:outer membrane immunogenic protein
MKRLFVAFLSVALIAGSAQAGGYSNSWSGDAPRWGGLYVGVHDGGAWGDTDWTLANGTTASPHQDAGVLFGGHAGYLGQWGAFVAGVEVSFSGLPNVDGNAWCPEATGVCRSQVENLLLLNGRLGFALGRTLLYATGGWARSTVEATRTTTVVATDDQHVSGWDIGGGIEFMLWPNVVFGVEYLRVDLDSQAFGLTDGGTFIESVSVDPELNIVRARFTVQLNRDAEDARFLK